KLSEFTLRTLDLMDKAEKGLLIDQELRKTDIVQGEAEKQKEGNGGIGPKPDHSKVSSQGELAGQPKSQVASGIEREEKRSVVVIALLGVAIAILVAIRPTTLTGVLLALFFVYVILFLGGYLVCMLIYVSDDLWSPQV